MPDLEFVKAGSESTHAREIDRTAPRIRSWSHLRPNTGKFSKSYGQQWQTRFNKKRERSAHWAEISRYFRQKGISSSRRKGRCPFCTPSAGSAGWRQHERDDGSARQVWSKLPDDIETSLTALPRTRLPRLGRTQENEAGEGGPRNRRDARRRRARVRRLSAASLAWWRRWKRLCGGMVARCATPERWRRSMPTKTSKSKASEGKPNALQKPLQPSEELAAVVGTGPLPRGEVVSKIWEYIRSHNLQNPENRREILAE
jgi:upstream activation factor subunit UAF30